VQPVPSVRRDQALWFVINQEENYEDVSHKLSASRYMDFAEHGAGLPGFFAIHSTIHSALERGECWDGRVVTLGDSQPSGEGRGSVSITLVSKLVEWKDEESGAKTILSVYTYRSVNALDSKRS